MRCKFDSRWTKKTALFPFLKSAVARFALIGRPGLFIVSLKRGHVQRSSLSQRRWSSLAAFPLSAAQICQELALYFCAILGIFVGLKLIKSNSDGFAPALFFMVNKNWGIVYPDFIL